MLLITVENDPNASLNTWNGVVCIKYVKSRLNVGQKPVVDQSNSCLIIDCQAVVAGKPAGAHSLYLAI